MKRKYRILKLKPFTYVTQTQLSFGDESEWWGLESDGCTWTTEEHQMRYCRSYTLSGAKSIIQANLKDKIHKETLREMFTKAEVVYEVEVDK